MSRAMAVNTHAGAEVDARFTFEVLFARVYGGQLLWQDIGHSHLAVRGTRPNIKEFQFDQALTARRQVGGTGVARHLPPGPRRSRRAYYAQRTRHTHSQGDGDRRHPDGMIK